MLNPSGCCWCCAGQGSSPVLGLAELLSWGVAVAGGLGGGGLGVGLAAARAEGRVGGRRRKLSAWQRATIADEVLAARSTAASMARRHKVSEATLSCLVAARRAGA